MMIAAVVYRVVQLVFLPFILIGYVLFVVKLVAYSRRSGTSATVFASFYTRYMQHRLQTRRDEAAARLMLAMPGVSRLGLVLLTGPTLIAHRLTGHVPRVYRYPYAGQPTFARQPVARTTYYDQLVEQHVCGNDRSAQVDQLVILGAGFDTRAYRLPLDVRTRVRCFEIDEPRTQAFKREMVRRTDVDTTGVIYVPADFDTENWFEKLRRAGFDPQRRSLFTWESVTMYLTREAVEGSLRTMATTAPGSVIAFDFVTNDLIASRSLFMRYSRAIINATGEPWTFGIDSGPPLRDRVTELVAGCGLTLLELRTFGGESPRKPAVAGLAVAVVPTRRADSRHSHAAPARDPDMSTR